MLELNFTAAAWKDALSTLRKCNFLAWEDEYYLLACDGMQWEMTIRRGRKKRLKKSGSNAYPEEFDLFRKFLDNCLDLRDLQGSGTFQLQRS